MHHKLARILLSQLTSAKLARDHLDLRAVLHSTILVLSVVIGTVGLRLHSYGMNPVRALCKQTNNMAFLYTVFTMPSYN